MPVQVPASDWRLLAGLVEDGWEHDEDRSQAEDDPHHGLGGGAHHGPDGIRYGRLLDQDVEPEPGEEEKGQHKTDSCNEESCGEREQEPLAVGEISGMQ